ncbi:MAG: CheB methylesterase [Gemmatimonadetes bacterium]|nr:CheB methylesterase [Gemmatimonadota bacterium]
MAISRDIIVIGGSAGAVEGLIRLMPGLPAALAARVFVTVHVPATVSALPSILTRVGHLTARHPADHDATEPSIVYVAPPDHHLLVKPGAVRVLRGPRENGHRPAIDPLFRSAAASYGPRVICVVLSGNLNDGSAGADAVAGAGGTVLVQDPAECVYPSMPAAALAEVPSATVLPLDQIARHLLALLSDPVPEVPEMTTHRSRRSLPVPDPVELGEPEVEALARSGVSSGLTCPECHGGIFEVDIEGTQQYRCRVGHAFTAEVLFSEQGASIEAALWTALRALEESAEMAMRLRDRATDRGSVRAATTYARNADTYEQRARVIRDLLQSGMMAGDGELSVCTRPIQQ